jgi:hypothetical protein
MSELTVVHDPDRTTCPICDEWVSSGSVEKALERGYFYCDSQRVRVISIYVIDEQVLT